MNRSIKCGLLVLVCTISSLLFTEAQSKTFYSGNGWRVAGIKSGNWLLSAYPEIVTSSKPFRYVASQGPGSIGCFVLELRNGTGLLWLPDTRITLTYKVDDKVREATSTECFFFSGCLTEIRRCSDVRYTAIPGVKGDLFMTPQEKVVVFAKFDFINGDKPEDIISCRVDGIKVIGGD